MEHKHIIAAFDVELDELRQSLLEMGGKVVKMIVDSVTSLVNKDTPLAEKTIALDREVNATEMSIDNRCLELLALRQPEAKDLRFIALTLKIVTDLERIGDKCSNIAKRARALNGESSLFEQFSVDIPHMGHLAEAMVKEALDAFVNENSDLAEKVRKDRSRMDGLNDSMQRILLTYAMENSETCPSVMKINYVSKALDRISDHATNIAEMAIYMVKGKDIRYAKT